MAETVAIEIDGRELRFELGPNETATLAAATGDATVGRRASKSFEDSIDLFGALAGKFAQAFEGRHISSAEISMGLKVTAKGDFVVVGSSGEASLSLKLTIAPKPAQPGS